MVCARTMNKRDEFDRQIIQTAHTHWLASPWSASYSYGSHSPPAYFCTNYYSCALFGLAFCWSVCSRVCNFFGRTYNDELMITHFHSFGPEFRFYFFVSRSRLVYEDAESISCRHTWNFSHGSTCMWFNGFFIFSFLTRKISRSRSCVPFIHFIVCCCLCYFLIQSDVEYLLSSCLNRKREETEKNRPRR